MKRGATYESGGTVRRKDNGNCMLRNPGLLRVRTALSEVQGQHSMGKQQIWALEDISVTG